MPISFLTRQPVLDHIAVFHDQGIVADPLLQARMGRSKAEIAAFDKFFAAEEGRLSGEVGFNIVFE